MVSGFGPHFAFKPLRMSTLSNDPLTPKPSSPTRLKPPQADVMWLFNASTTTLVLTMTFDSLLFYYHHSLTCQLAQSCSPIVSYSNPPSQRTPYPEDVR